MENKKFITFFILISLFFFNIQSVFAYDAETHAALVKETGEFYNNYFPNKLSGAQIDLLMKGARLEDDGLRPLNHFYDPINNAGLHTQGLSWGSSKDWAQNSDRQLSALYNPILNTTIAGMLAVSNPVALKTTDYTWQRAISDYVNGNEERGLEALGHILHLIEDKAVPAHVRNDPHLNKEILSYNFGNPDSYETWAEKFTSANIDLSERLLKKTPIYLSNINSYFDEIAKYTNTHFYSDDRIGVDYYVLPTPTIDNSIIIGNYRYNRSRDEDGFYYLSAQPKISSVIFGVKGSITLVPNEDDLIFRDYWSRLSVKAVQYGAGVIDLFFQEVEKEKNNPKFAVVEEESLVAQAIDLAGQVIDSVKQAVSFTVGKIKESVGVQEQNLIAQISLDEDIDEIIGPKLDEIIDEDEERLDSGSLAGMTPHQSATAPELSSILDKGLDAGQAGGAEMTDGDEDDLNEEVEEYLLETDLQEQEQDELNSDNNLEQNDLLNSDAQEEQIVSLPTLGCFFETIGNPSHQGLLINEVAWMGSSGSVSDEWIELKNISGAELDVSNWQILDKSEQIKIVFPLNTKIATGGFLLLERTDDNSASNVEADIIYTGALSNSDEGLRLFDNQCNLVDEVLADSSWPAGDNVGKKTMERDFSGLGWHTSSVINGTPKAENSLPAIVYYGGGGGSTQTNADSTQTNVDNNIQAVKILISEIQISPIGDRFIELYNPNDSSVNLTNWYIQRKIQSGDSFSSLVSKTYFENKTIDAYGYFLISRESLDGTDIVLDSLTLTESNAIQFKNSNSEVVDKVGWGEAGDCEGNCATQILDNQSIQRKIQNNEFIDTDNNSTDFELRDCPSPKAQSTTCQVSETNQAPSAFFAFSPEQPEIGEDIIFNAASSTDSDGSIVLYEWNFGDEQLASTTQATTTHNYLLAGDYTVDLMVFDNSGATSTVEVNLNVASSTSSDLLTAPLSVNHILISEIQAGIASSSKDEFVELYNPNNQEINLSGWSLKRRVSQVATSTENYLVLNFSASSTIPAKGFFLITHNDYVGQSFDLKYSNNSNPLAYTDDVVILINKEDEVVDEVYYIDVPEDKSLERKANASSTVESMISGGEDEFLGNGYDTDEDSNFVLLDVSNPQNSSSLSEPRLAPIQVSNFSAQYDKDNKEINFSWDNSQDYFGATTTLSYKITDISSSPILEDLIIVSSTTATTSIDQLGRDYVFSIQVFDKDGLGSDVSSVSVLVPSTTIEEVDYFLLNQTNQQGHVKGSVGQVFKPFATGVMNTVGLIFRRANNKNGFINIRLNLYEWLGGATTTPALGKGDLLAESNSREEWVNAFDSSALWTFGDIVLDADKYYFLETVLAPQENSNLGIEWATMSPYSPHSINGYTWLDGSKHISYLYIVIKAVEQGEVSVVSPINSYIYEDSSNINLELNYLESVDNEYNTVVVETRDFYTNEVINNSVFNLEENQRIIGWHSLSAGLLQNMRPGFFTVSAALTNCFDFCAPNITETEIYFSVLGVSPQNGMLLNQSDFIEGASVGVRDPVMGYKGPKVAQTFKPMASGILDSITLKLETSGNGFNNYFWKIYEWLGGEINSREGNKGELLATSIDKEIRHNSAHPDPRDLTWDFSGDNEINLNTDNYYYLELNVIGQEKPTYEKPTLSFKVSRNDSLIDGKIYTQYLSGKGDLYLFIKGNEE
ncbi:lamin tail domain-containing protein [Patescibacteria group bacterium]|nr:lamin tail domain-containing protein [Patescibacteria group bacterium]